MRPILERESGLKCGRDFKVGYSPERINPGDKVHRLINIRKIVSGIDGEALREIQAVYNLVIEAGTYPVSNIRTAEAVKVVENSQRDVNIAFMNELAMVFDRMNIDTNEVIEGMNTKWNALGFRPGLVGGYCIGVDLWADSQEAKSEYGIELVKLEDIRDADCVIAAVAHNEFREFSIDRIEKLFKADVNRVLIDVKGIYRLKDFADKEYLYWRL